MDRKDFHTTMLVDLPVREAFEGVHSRVREWWTKNFEGCSEEENDIFIVDFGPTFITFKVIELIGNERIVWKVIDCHLHFLKNRKEWRGTTVRWEFSPKGDATQIDMTHAGLVPGMECYESCKKGWTFFVQQSLHRLLTEGKGEPDIKEYVVLA